MLLFHDDIDQRNFCDPAKSELTEYCVQRPPDRFVEDHNDNAVNSHVSDEVQYIT